MLFTAQLYESVNQRSARFNTHVRRYAEVILSPQPAGFPPFSDNGPNMSYASVLGIPSTAPRKPNDPNPLGKACIVCGQYRLWPLQHLREKLGTPRPTVLSDPGSKSPGG
jgi:hypothetical protein